MELDCCICMADSLGEWIVSLSSPFSFFFLKKKEEEETVERQRSPPPRAYVVLTVWVGMGKEE